MKNILVLAAAAGLGLTGCSTVNDALYATGVASDVARLGSGCSKVTLANYNKIKIGMSLSQVNSILDCSPDEGSRSANGSGGEVVSYAYGGVGDAFISIVTNNGKLTNKSKSGI